MAKISINPDLCIGCDSCSSSCPKLFGMKNGKSYTKKKEVSGKELELAKKVASDCPVNAIKIE